MAKRYTDNGKWNKNWFSNLDNNAKLFWFFILDHCDHAGLLDINYKLFKFHLGFEIDKNYIDSIFDNKIIWIEEDKIFIPSFIDFQYGILDETNRVHKSVLNNLDPYKGLISLLKGYKDKDKDKAKVKDEDKYKEECIKIMDYFNLVCKKRLTLDENRTKIISKRLKEGKTKEQLCQAITNFSKDTWEGRSDNCDIVYAIGVRDKVDKFDKWYKIGSVKQSPLDLLRAKKE